MKTKNTSILIVEDEFIFREAFVNNLKELGYFNIFEAINSKDALFISKQEKIDLSFIDIGLSNSNLDGIELAKEIKTFSKSAIIFITSYSDKITLERVKNVEFDDYLLKPIDKRRLIVAIELLFNSINKSQVFKNPQFPKSLNQLEKSEDIFVKGNSKFFDKIKANAIIYVKAELGGINIVTTKKNHFTYVSLNSFIDYYNNPLIIRIHRSYAVNKLHVIGKSETEIKMDDGTVLPIGTKQKEKVNKYFLLLKPKTP